MKNYLHAYIAYTQDNWVDQLLMAKFAVSNYVNAFIDMTLFFANYGFHSCIDIKPPRTYKGEQKVELLAADKIDCKQKKIMSFL